MKYRYYDGKKLLRESPCLLATYEEVALKAKALRVVRVNTHSFKPIAPSISRLRLQTDRGHVDVLVKHTKRGTCIWRDGWKQLTIGRTSDIARLIRITC